MSKGKIIAIVTALAAIIVLVSVVIFNSTKDDNQEEQVQLHEVPEIINPADESDPAGEESVGSTEIADAETSDTVDPKSFKYDPFAEDAGWGSESIFGESRISIEGSGKRDTSNDNVGSNISIEGESPGDNYAEKNTRELTASEAQAAMMEKVKSSDYTYRINENDFSDGFAVYINPKYNLGVGRIMRDTGYINGPNNTEVGISELDPAVSLEEHRKKVLTDAGFGIVYRMTSEPIMEYNTPVIEGVGVDNFENTPMYTAWRYDDVSVNESGGQLYCDTEMKSTFGSGYYIERYSPGSLQYYGTYIVEHNGRIFKATGMSDYRDTLLDVVLAAIDTCVYPY